MCNAHLVGEVFLEGLHINVHVKQNFYCVKYPYLILTSAYMLAGANMGDQTGIFLK